MRELSGNEWKFEELQEYFEEFERVQALPGEISSLS
jgi:hypothetical protein